MTDYLSDSDAMAHLSALSSGSAFVLKLPLMLLPRAQRNAILTIYAFGKAVDDIADDLGVSPVERVDQLSRWREVLDENLVEAVDQVFKVYDLDPHDLELFVSAMKQDAMASPFVFETIDQMELYIENSSSAVARMILPILGHVDEQALAFAQYLARGLKATNMARDFVEDALEGRLYIPQSLIEDGEALSEELRTSLGWLKGEMTASARQAVWSAAERNLTHAKEAWSAASRPSLMPAYLIMKVYQGLLPEKGGL